MPPISAAGAGSSTPALHRCRPSCRPSCRRRSTTSRHPKWCWSSSGGSACRRPPVRGSILRALIRRRPRRLSVRPTGRCFSPRPTYCRDWCRGPFTTTMPTMPCACPSDARAFPVGSCAGEPPGRTQRLPGVVRPFGASVGRRLGAGVRRADVAFARDVRHDACKLSFRDPCVEQGPGPH